MEVLSLAIAFLFFQLGRVVYWEWVSDREDQRRIDNFVWPPAEATFVELLARQQEQVEMMARYHADASRLAYEQAKLDHQREQLEAFESRTTH